VVNLKIGGIDDKLYDELKKDSGGREAIGQPANAFPCQGLYCKKTKGAANEKSSSGTP
jgi:hypothetical protein